MLIETPYIPPIPKDPPEILLARAQSSGDGFIRAKVLQQHAWNAARAATFCASEDSLVFYRGAAARSDSAWTRFARALEELSEAGGMKQAVGISKDVADRAKAIILLVSESDSANILSGHEPMPDIGIDMAPRLSLFSIKEGATP